MMMFTGVSAVFLLGLFLASCERQGSGSSGASPEKVVGEEQAVLTDAPNVPPPITRDHPTTVIVKLETRELVKELADGVKYTFWTFGGSVPGKFIRIRQNDEVQFHLRNHPDSKMPHNIDLHAVTGAGGGAEASFTAPGHESVFSFKALNPGLYVYHCATAPVGMHIANGMYGLILVEPIGGMAPVDREFYIMQSDFYTKGRYGEEGLQPFDMDKAIREEPDYVVFNGRVGALVGDNAIKANVGETVRLYVGNGGPNLVSSFHVIGEIFDAVYQEGGTLVSQKNVQTTLVPAGGSAITEFKLDVPGTLILVDHSIFRAFNKGAIGMLKAEGPEDKVIYSGKQLDNVYHPEGSAVQTTDFEEKPADKELSIAELKEKGQRVYNQVCAACHQLDGKGIPGTFPPVANSDYMMENKNRSIKILLEGMEGPITVNGEKYDGVMPKLSMTDGDIAAVLTFLRSTWGNKGDAVMPGDVRAMR